MSALSLQLGGEAKSVITITDAAAIVLGPVDVQGYTNLGFYMQNTLVGGNDIETVSLETAPEMTGPWTVVDDALNGAGVGGLIAAEETKYAAITDASFKYIRLKAACVAAGTTTLTLWVCASQRG